MEYIAAILPIISLFIYAILLSIECGGAVFMAEPKLIGSDDLAREYINPAWETTNVFLIFSLIWLIAFFPGAVAIWGHELILPFLIFLVVMGIRSAGMLYIFYKEGESRAIKFLFIMVSLAAPMTLAGGIMPFFITGTMPYGVSEWLLALDFACLAFASVLLISSSFFRYLVVRKGSRVTKRLDLLVRFSIIYFLAVTCLSFGIFSGAAPRIAEGMLSYLAIFILFTILNLVFVHFFLAVALFGVVFFAIMLSQLPYVIYPAITIYSSFTDPASANIMLGVAGVAALFIIPSLILLYYLIVFKKN